MLTVGKIVWVKVTIVVFAVLGVILFLLGIQRVWRRGTAVLIGFETLYRLDRLSGRYWNLSRERTGPRTVYSLSEEPGLDLWIIARKYTRWIPWMDAVYGSATYMPMVDGARYTVSVSSSGLLARPGNDIAHKAIGEWR